MAFEYSVGGGGKKESQEFPLWRYVTKIGQFVGDGSHQWVCNVCGGGPYRGSYVRVKAHLLRESGKGVAGCPKSTNALIAKYMQEHEDAVEAKMKKQATKAATTSSTTTPAGVERIVAESRKRACPPNGSIAQMFDVHGREEVDSRVVQCIYACGLPFNIVRSPYWQDMIRAINNAPQGYTTPKYERVRTTLLYKERSLVEGMLEPIRGSWRMTGVSLVADGWTDMANRPLINIIAMSPMGVVFFKVVDCSGEVKDSDFVAKILIDAIESVGAHNVVQVITDNGPVCKAAGMLVEGTFKHIFWTPCIVHSLNLMLKEMVTTEEYLELRMIGVVCEQAKEMQKFITNHHVSQAMFRQFLALELLKVAETRFASHYIMLKRMVQVKDPLMHMVSCPEWQGWRQSSTEKAISIRQNIVDETWWEDAQFLLDMWELILELLGKTDTDVACLGDVYDDMDTTIERVHNVIVVAGRPNHERFWEAIHAIMSARWDKFNTPLHTLAHALNPKYYDPLYIGGAHNRKAPNDDVEVFSGFKAAIAKLFPDDDEELEVRKQYADFATRSGLFGDLKALLDRGKMKANQWWANHGAGTQLKALASRVLAQVASSSAAERNWSTYGYPFS